jgi:starch synthase
MPFMVAENETGFLIDPDDTAQVAGRLKQLLQDPAAARRMGRAGRLVAEQRFAPWKVAEQTRALYQKLVNSPDVPRHGSENSRF